MEVLGYYREAKVEQRIHIHGGCLRSRVDASVRWSWQNYLIE